MAIQALSFDADGTLFTLDFSSAIWLESIPKQFARIHGLSLDEAREEVFGRYATMGEENFLWFDINHWSRELNLGDPHELLEPYLDRISIFPDVEEMLERLGGRYRLIVSSNSPREILEAEFSGYIDRFDHVFSVPSDFRMKKGPEYFEKLRNLFDLEAEEMAHVGDRYQDDFLAAKESGLHAFHLDRKGERGPDKVNSLLEFLDKVNELEDSG